jgi:hypothetical protein
MLYPIRPTGTTINPMLPRMWLFAVLAGAFVMAHTLAPLYFSNQNQYLLHGAAEAGVGFLDRDWLANTADPTPVFSGLVAATYRWPGELGLHVEYGVVLVVYFFSLALVPKLLPGQLLKPGGYFVFCTLLILVHAAALRWLSVRVFGIDYPWYFQDGVAGQYVLGPSLQPSVFGVLLITSLVAFAYDRLALAAICCAAAAIMHPTYLLPGGLLIAGYMVALARAGRWRAALAVGVGTLAAVAPVLVYSFREFGPSSPDQFAEAQRILAETRIPHHASVHQWLDPIGAMQLVWAAVGLWLVRRTALLVPLLFLAGGGLLLTVAQVATESYSLALLFPWRVTTILVPMATCVILAQVVWLASPWMERPPAIAGALALLAAAVAGGILVMVLGLGYLGDEGELPLTDYVRDHKRSGEVYLVPARFPAVGAAPRGSVSTTFREPQRASLDAKLIPVDLQRFRLLAEAPIFIDFKSVPYKDTDVLEWHRRLTLCQQWYDRNDWDDPAIRRQLQHEGITHVIMSAGKARDARGLELVFADQRYRLYRLRP